VQGLRCTGIPGIFGNPTYYRFLRTVERACLCLSADLALVAARFAASHGSRSYSSARFPHSAASPNSWAAALASFPVSSPVGQPTTDRLRTLYPINAEIVARACPVWSSESPFDQYSFSEFTSKISGRFWSQRSGEALPSVLFRNRVTVPGRKNELHPGTIVQCSTVRSAGLSKR